MYWKPKFLVPPNPRLSCFISASTLGAVIGPWIVGKMVDVSGEYSYGWLVAGLAAFLAVPALIFAEKPSQMIK